MANGPGDSPYNACVIDVTNRMYWYWDKGILWNSWRMIDF
jgi:hypothetical protein